MSFKREEHVVVGVKKIKILSAILACSLVVQSGQIAFANVDTIDIAGESYEALKKQAIEKFDYYGQVEYSENLI